MVEQLGELAGIRRCRSVGKLACRVEGYSGLGGIGNHETYFRLLREGHVGGEIGIGVDAPGDDVDKVHAVHGLPVQEALEVEVIEAVLLVEPFDHAFLDGLDHHHGAVKIGLLVGLPDNPLDERAEEVAFAELDYLLCVPLCLRCACTI